MATSDGSVRGAPDISFHFGNVATAPREARRVIGEMVADHEIAFAVELVTSELVSNVVQHTTAGGLLEVWRPAPGAPLRLAVTDTLPAWPREASCSDGGRGMSIVDALCDTWGVQRTDPGTTAWGKTVWAEFSGS